MFTNIAQEKSRKQNARTCTKQLALENAGKELLKISCAGDIARGNFRRRNCTRGLATLTRENLQDHSCTYTLRRSLIEATNPNAETYDPHTNLTRISPKSKESDRRKSIPQHMPRTTPQGQTGPNACPQTSRRRSNRTPKSAPTKSPTHPRGVPTKTPQQTSPEDVQRHGHQQSLNRHFLRHSLRRLPTHAPKTPAKQILQTQPLEDIPTSTFKRRPEIDQDSRKDFFKETRKTHTPRPQPQNLERKQASGTHTRQRCETGTRGASNRRGPRN